MTSHLECTPNLDALHTALAGLGAVPGADKLQDRVRDEWTTLSRTSVACAKRQGALNNLNGAAAELQVWGWVPSPVAMQRNVQSFDRVQRATIDIIAADGLWWVEVKATALFGTSSSAWTGLRAQVLRLRACAACHLVGWRRPVVLVAFTLGCSDEVAQALDFLGVAVVRPELGGSGGLPPVLSFAASLGLPLPPQERPAHLDLSTLLAFVSSSVHLPPTDSRLLSWASPNTHWSRSLEEEARCPLFPKLEAALEKHTVWAASATDIARLEALLHTAGGGAEQRRWAILKPQLEVSFPPTLRRDADTDAKVVQQ